MGGLGLILTKSMFTLIFMFFLIPETLKTELSLEKEKLDFGVSGGCLPNEKNVLNIKKNIEKKSDFGVSGGCVEGVWRVCCGSGAHLDLKMQ